MNHIHRALLAAAVFLPSVLAHAEMQPGLWEVTTQVEMPGFHMAPNTIRHCYTKADVADSRKTMPVDSKCEVSETAHQGNTVSWKMRCSSPQAMTGSGTMTQDSTTYNGTVHMSMQGMDMTQKFAGKRVGDCGK